MDETASERVGNSELHLSGNGSYFASMAVIESLSSETEVDA
jgi:hypothetical protein